jgi:ribosome-associated heat shock protein Hsp15
MTASDAQDLAPPGSQRLDKWLWFARVVKSRTLASSLVVAGKIRVNRDKASKPSQTVKKGDVITFVAGRTVRVLEVTAPGTRRGPATEAQTLYKELTATANAPKTDTAGHTASMVRAVHGERMPGAGRPTKRDRRLIDRLTGRASDSD